MRRKGYVGHHREAEWVLEGHPPLLRVTSAYGEKVTQLGEMPPQLLARLLLSELIADGLTRGPGAA